VVLCALKINPVFVFGGFAFFWLLGLLVLFRSSCRQRQVLPSDLKSWLLCVVGEWLSGCFSLLSHRGDAPVRKDRTLVKRRSCGDEG
jgi:hypothetical protein